MSSDSRPGTTTRYLMPVERSFICVTRRAASSGRPRLCPGAAPDVSRHGFGYSVFEHADGGIQSELWVYVAQDAAVKFSVLKVRNSSGRPRRLSATGYVEWVLGDLRPKSAMHVASEVDPYSGAIFTRNRYNTEFPDRVAFFDVDDTSRTFTCDRAEFIGRNGSLEHPAAMMRTHLSGRVGSGLDPCAAIQWVLIWRTGSNARSPSGSALAECRAAMMPISWCIDCVAPMLRGGPWRRSGITGTTPSAQCRSRRPTSR